VGPHVFEQVSTYLSHHSAVSTILDSQREKKPDLIVNTVLDIDTSPSHMYLPESNVIPSLIPKDIMYHLELRILLLEI